MGAFSIVAEGGSHKIDRKEVMEAAEVLFGLTDWHELRALPSGRGKVVQGPQAILAAAEALCDEAVYYSLNPVSQGSERANKKTVTHRQWLPIDIDTKRPKDVSATEAEKAKSAEVAHAILTYLSEQGWPSPILIDSGNGWHLLYRIDLPNDSLSAQIVKRVTYALKERFDSAFGEVDKATHDAPRVFKLPGTCARKGPDTADRPWRMARIVGLPETMEIVTVEQLQAICEPETQPATPSSFNTRTTERSLDAYVQSAVNQECGKIALSVERNNALNDASFRLGTMAGWPEVREVEIKDALRRAACIAGLDRDSNCGLHGIEKTIKSGWEAGAKSPRQRPEDQGRSGNNQTKPLPNKLTIRLREIKPRKVAWLWENIVARGFISIFAGRTGMGKSFVACDLAARMTRGEAPACSTLERPPCHVLFISEDPPEYMIGPRLMEMHANQDLISFMTFEAMAQFNLSQLDLLEAAYQECGRPGLIIIDPPTNFLGKTDEHKNSELRSVLMGIVAWINRHDAACVMITHLNKAVGKGLDAVSRVMGSVAWVSTARIMMVFEQDPDKPTQFLMGGGKNNLGQKAGTLAYEIESAGDCAVVKWVGPVETSADDAVNKVKKKNRGERAGEWLEDRFRERRSWAAEELYALGKTDGVSRSAIWDIVGSLPIQKHQETPQDGSPRFWQWTAIPPWPPEKELKSCETLKSCDANPLNGNDFHSVSKSDQERNAGHAERNAENDPDVSGFQDDGKSETLRKLFGGN